MFNDSNKVSNEDPIHANTYNEYKWSLEKHYQAISDELIEDAIIELCFEIHKAAKTNFSVTDKLVEPNLDKTQNNSRSVKANKSIVCYECGHRRGTNKFSTHLFECINKREGNVTSRKAKTKITTFKESEEEDFEDYYDEDPAIKKSKKSKKGQRGKTKSLGNSLSRTFLNSSPMFNDSSSLEERKAFFNQKCGVLSKRTKKMCMNSQNCVYHTDDERRDARILHKLLSDDNEEEADDEQIDIDTVDVEVVSAESGFIENLSIPSAYSSGSSSYF